VQKVVVFVCFLHLQKDLNYCRLFTPTEPSMVVLLLMTWNE
jgi:hypothetical protein